MRWIDESMVNCILCQPCFYLTKPLVLHLPNTFQPRVLNFYIWFYIFILHPIKGPGVCFSSFLLFLILILFLILLKFLFFHPILFLFLSISTYLYYLAFPRLFLFRSMSHLHLTPHDICHRSFTEFLFTYWSSEQYASSVEDFLSIVILFVTPFEHPMSFYAL